MCSFKTLSLFLVTIFNIFLLMAGIATLVKGYHYSKKAIDDIMSDNHGGVKALVIIIGKKRITKYVRYLFFIPGTIVSYVAACGLLGLIKRESFWLYSICILSSIGGIIYQFCKGEWTLVGSIFFLTDLGYFGLDRLEPVTELILEILALLLTLVYLYCSYNEDKAFLCNESTRSERNSYQARDNESCEYAKYRSNSDIPDGDSNTGSSSRRSTSS